MQQNPFEQLLVAHLIKMCPAFSRCFITLFTWGRQWTLHRATWIHFTSWHTVS